MKGLFKSRKTIDTKNSPPPFDFTISQNKVQSLLDELLKKVEIINSTVDIHQYFSTYDECIAIVKKLIPYEHMQGFSYSEDIPSSMLKIFTEKKQPSLRNFLERSAEIHASFHIDDSSTERQNAYESFCRALKPYYSRFDNENRAFLENQCKETFYSISIDYRYEFDSLIEEAIKAVISEQMASTTILQRKLRLGYGRAAIIMDCLEQIGIVGPASGSMPRKVLISESEYIRNRSYYIYQISKSEYSESKHLITESIRTEEPISKEIDDLDGYEFESFCCKVLAASNFSNIKQTKLSGDDGIDIIAEKDGIIYGFQCKCYSSPVGIKAVQEAFTGAKMYNCDIAIVITNNIFTPQAIHAAEQTRVRLWDRSKLIEMAKAL